MSGEVWEEIYDRLEELIEAHRTTLVFVNTRRLAERLARHLAEQCGAEVDRAGRVAVEPDLTLPGHPEVFVVGDMMNLDALPGVESVDVSLADKQAIVVGPPDQVTEQVVIQAVEQAGYEARPAEANAGSPG